MSQLPVRPQNSIPCQTATFVPRLALLPILQQSSGPRKKEKKKKKKKRKKKKKKKSIARAVHPEFV